ncbi:hypothetical protein OB08_13715 [Microbacterium sp. HJ5]
MRAPRWVRELLGWATALAVAVAAVAAVASSPRGDLLFRDGDSLVTSLVVRSVAAGQPQDWAMSSVLFLPETAVLGALSLLGLGVAGTLALAGVVNLLALYGALRVAAGAASVAGPAGEPPGAPGAAHATRAPVAGALLALTGFALLMVTETSPSRDALELASLLTTTTYYSAAVVATVLVVGFARRAVEAPGRRWPLWLTGAVAAASVLSNPLFAAWAVVPLVLVLALVAVIAPAVRRSAVWMMVALVAGSVVGFAGRMPLARLIANTGAGYADPSRWLESAGYYGALVLDRGSTLLGGFGIALGVGLWVWCIVAAAILARRSEIGPALVAACGAVMPVLVAVGAVALGTHAARYLEPLAFAPVLGLVVLPGLLGRRERGPSLPVLAGAAALSLVAASAIGIPRLSSAASAPDPDLDCVVKWTDASSRTGAGQFWTVRLAKAHLDDPRRLVQVDHELRGYAWLVNRDDFRVGEVSFLVIDEESVPFALPEGATLDDATLIDCGRYTIADFGERTLGLGPQRS